MLYGIENFSKLLDGVLNIFIPNAEGIRGQHVAFLASLSSPALTFEQIPVIHALPKLFVASFTLVLLFFPIGTSSGGPISLVTFDIHACCKCTIGRIAFYNYF
jgi:hypothetical protein